MAQLIPIRKTTDQIFVVVSQFSFPDPFSNARLTFGALTWSDKFAIHWQRSLCVEIILPIPEALENFPSNFKKNLLRAHEIFSQMMVYYDEEEDTLPFFEALVDLGVKQIAHKKSVQSRDLLEKIKLYKTEVLILYLTSDGALTKRKIDEAMVISQTGRLRYENQRVIHNYWTSLMKSSDGLRRHTEVENQVYMLFFKALLETASKLGSLQKFEIQSGHFIKTSFLAAVKKVAFDLRRKIKRTPSNQEKVELEYILFKGSLLVMPVIRVMVRRILEPFIIEITQEIKSLALSKKQQIDQNIEFYKQCLESDKCCTDPEKIEKEWSLPLTRELMLKMNTFDKEIYLNLLKEEESKTYENCLEWAYEYSKQHRLDIKELQSTLDEENEYDRKVIQALSMSFGIDFNKPFDLVDFLNDKVDVDFLPDNPIEFFKQKFVSRDQEILALFSNVTKASFAADGFSTQTK